MKIEQRIEAANNALKQARLNFASENFQIATKMRRQREVENVSLRALAKAMKVSAPFLSDLELGRRNWTVELVRKFQTALAQWEIPES